MSVYKRVCIVSNVTTLPDYMLNRDMYIIHRVHRVPPLLIKCVLASSVRELGLYDGLDILQGYINHYFIGRDWGKF